MEIESNRLEEWRVWRLRVIWRIGGVQSVEIESNRLEECRVWRLRVIHWRSGEYGDRARDVECGD